MRWNKQILYLVGAMVFMSVSSAIPVPKGIDGTIFELDGLTPVPNGIYFEVTNLNTNEVVSSRTGAWGQGAYSASLGGNDFNQILVKAWSEYNQANVTFILQGVLHNANLLLNMSIPTLPPIVTSSPPLVAYKNQLYRYQTNATDENNDILTFSLAESPLRMNISEYGLVQWIPKTQDIGHHIVRIVVSDGTFRLTQDYLLYVENVNAPPFITSIPPTAAVVRRPYFYDINATDPDGDILSYGILQGAQGMKINASTGLIEWLPLRKQRGIVNVSAIVSDGNASTNQSFSVRVRFPREKLGEGLEDIELDGTGLEDIGLEDTGGGDAVLNTVGTTGTGTDKSTVSSVLAHLDGKKIESIPASKSDILSVTSLKADVEELPQRPQETSPLSKPVYKYFKIRKTEALENPGSEIEISFRIENEWLKRKNISGESMALSRYTNRWAELPTVLLTDDGSYSYYASKTPSISYFAIHGRDEMTQTSEQLVVSTINAPYQLSGIVYFFGKRRQIPSNTPISITNQKINETIILKTGVGQLSGAFSLFLRGNYSDPLLISVPEYGQTFKTKLKDNNALYLSLSLKNSGLMGISGFSIKEGIEPSLIGAVVALLAIFLIIHAQTLIYKKR